MKKHRVSLFFTILILAGTILGNIPVGVTAQTTVDLNQVARQRVAERYGLPLEMLAVINSATVTYPLQGSIAHEFKIIDNRDGTIYGVALNEQGQELDLVQLECAEESAYAAKYGRLEPALAEALSMSEGGGNFPVIIWLKEPSYSRPERPDPDSSANLTAEEIEAFLSRVDAQRATAVQAITGPVLDRLSKMGYTASADSYAPALYAQLSAAEIREIAGWAEVDLIYLDGISEPALDVVRPTIRANTVHSRGITGAGVKVAQIEVGGRVATGNPYLSGVVQDTTYVCTSPNSHSTGVAGIIRSTHTSYKGIAYGASLRAGGSCGGINSQLQNRSTAAADWGARALNLSFGANTGRTLGSMDRFYDSMVINRYRTVVVAAGNEAGPCGSGTGNVLSPGLAYNVITVGNFDDRNTTNLSDDVMQPCSSWRDPNSSHADREKPEIAAPGTNIKSTTTAYPWTGNIGSGTSFAAPAVTGAAALLIQRNNNLSTWPEAIKAILMITALHNIEGGTRLSEYDGAGGVLLDRADNVASRASGSNWGARSYSCSTGSPLDVTTMYLTAGMRTRIAITWDNDPAYSGYTSKPSADLDLQVINPSGSLVVGSYSWDNTYEIVDFTPATTGNYRLRVVRYRCDYSPDWLGWAWRKGS